MQALINIIVDLLGRHTCVIIPDFGGFVLNDKNAGADYDTDRFFPPHKEVIFNSHLTHNDGLLAQAVMLAENTSFDEASRKIAGKIQEAKKELETNKKYPVGKFGFFTLEKNGIVFYGTNELKVENREAFGLKEFYFPAIYPAVKILSGNRNEKSASLSRMLIGGAAAAVTMFLLLQPVRNDANTDYASFAPLAALTEVFLHAEFPVKGDFLQTSAFSPEKDYYLIVEEFATEEDAVFYIHNMKMDEGDLLEILPTQEKFFVTFSSASDFGEGMPDKIQYLRSRYPGFSNAYILGLK